MKKTKLNQYFYRHLVRWLEGTYISKLAVVEVGVSVKPGSAIWEFSKIRSGAIIGMNVTIGMNVYIGQGVRVGDKSKIQNNASVYEPAELGEGVFIGPGAILTNDKYPRATDNNGEKILEHQWKKVGVMVHNFASIGAGAICIAPISIGTAAMIAAGAVVTKDVPNYSKLAGVPGREIS